MWSTGTVIVDSHLAAGLLVSVCGSFGGRCLVPDFLPLMFAVIESIASLCSSCSSLFIMLRMRCDSCYVGGGRRFWVEVAVNTVCFKKKLFPWFNFTRVTLDSPDSRTRRTECLFRLISLRTDLEPWHLNSDQPRSQILFCFRHEKKWHCFLWFQEGKNTWDLRLDWDSKLHFTKSQSCKKIWRLEVAMKMIPSHVYARGRICFSCHALQP